jgi:hypothetical protein
MAIEMANKVGTLIHCCFVDCRPGGRRGDTKGVVARWRRSVASGEALDMLHRAMCSVSHRHTVMAIEMARDGGHSFATAAYFDCYNRS